MADTAMARVADYTSRASIPLLRSLGIVGVCRYISLEIEATRWKRITQSEYDELEAAGIQVTLNWEYAAKDWLGGSSAGRNHGRTAVALAKALGYPQGRVIAGSADWDMVRSEWTNKGQWYGGAFADEIRLGGYRPGVYGSWDVLKWCRDELGYDAFWQSMSRAFSQGRNANTFPGVHLRQRNSQTINGFEFDWNDVGVWPLWGGNPIARKAIQEMLYMVRKKVDDAPAVNLYNDRGEFRGHIPDEATRDAFKAQGVPYLEAPPELYDTMTTPASQPEVPSARDIAREIVAEVQSQ